MRKILCEACGIPKPTPPEDAAKGLFPRWVKGEVKRLDVCCDNCGKKLPIGAGAVAISIPKDMGAWEHEYLDVPVRRKVHPDDDVCPSCGTGFRLPSGVCDHCNQPFPKPETIPSPVTVAEAVAQPEISEAEVEKLSKTIRAEMGLGWVSIDYCDDIARWHLTTTAPLHATIAELKEALVLRGKQLDALLAHCDKDEKGKV